MELEPISVGAARCLSPGALDRDSAFLPAVILQVALRGGPNVFSEEMRSRWERDFSTGWGAAWLAAFEAMKEQRWKDAERSFSELVELEESLQEYLDHGRRP